MKLTTKSRYGLRAMLELAVSRSEWPLALNIIAQRQSIPEPYLERLMQKLRKAGLVESTRGSSGGYELASNPCEISVGSIIRALEGSLAPVSCVEDDEYCSHSNACAMHLLWAKINAGLESVYDSVYLSDAAEGYNEQKGACSCSK